MVLFQNRYIQAAQQLVRLWSGARGAKAGPLDSLRGELKAIAAQVGIDLEVARRLTPESLELLIVRDPEADPLRVWLGGELFYVAARLWEMEGAADEAEAWDRLSLRLLHRVDPDALPATDLPDPGERIREITGRLEGV
jgi:hypothetical protein